MKTLKRIIIGLFFFFFLCIVINSKTRFFKDIDKNIPFLGTKYPKITEFISDLSDKVNELVSYIPTPAEFIAKVRNTELPINPDDIAGNIYYSSNSMLNFYNKCNISVALSGNDADIYGVSDNPNDKYIVYRFLDENGEMLHQEFDIADSEGKFRRIVPIPDNAHQLTVFTGANRYGEFLSTVHDYVFLTTNENGDWEIAASPVYEHNVAMYEKPKSKSSALKNTYDICYKEPEIMSLAQEITQGMTTDYEKAAAIHDWVCSNIYYDSDSIDGTLNNAPYVASDVLETRRAVCLGYANLYAALCRSVNIPCNVVLGYSLGIASGDTAWNDENIYTNDPNHSWNEVYIDNRWVIVDTTWDSKNKYSNKKYETDTDVLHIYFDANIKFFSANHKITEYIR